MTEPNPAKCWLGREDSNLRMPVPKTGPIPCFLRCPLRNDLFSRNEFLRVCAHFAEGIDHEV